MNDSVVDAHVHCGTIDRYPGQAFEDYVRSIQGSLIRGAVMFSPVAEIYDRYDSDFIDNRAWQKQREKSNNYLLTLRDREIEIIPYFFIWNDFAVEQLSKWHKGIKWHRHADEPEYHYHDPRCKAAMNEIKRRRFPVVLEEEFANTIMFINDVAIGVDVIIPHLGLLNGGYEALASRGVWEKSNVYTDTSLAAGYTVTSYLKTYGYQRIMFGSDFPFGNPVGELDKVLNLNIPENQKRNIAGENIRRLLEKTRH